ncbi:MAG: acylphosphatase [Pirellulaceae bacterium]|nr:acylphosphatase [Pirellulaceae bacterium]
MPNDQRRELLYTGQVQGVGFRYTARRIAQDHAVRGYVKNLPSGEVRLVVEGAADEVEAFLRRLEQAMEGYIGSKSSELRPASGEFAGFEIRH